MKIALLPLHRVISATWGSELTEAYRFAVELSKIPTVEILAVVGFADEQSESVLVSKMKLINLNISPGFNFLSFIRFQKGVLSIGKEIGESYDVVHHFWPSTAFQSFSSYPFLHRGRPRFVFGPILFPQQELLSVDSRVYSERLGWTNSPAIDQYMKFSGPIFKYLHHQTLLRCDHIFYDSYTTREFLLEKFASMREVESSIIPSSFVHVKGDPLPVIPKDELVVGVLAYYRRTKHADVLLRAVAKMAARKIRVIFAGEGPILPELRALAHSLNISHLVTFLGHVDDENLMRFRSSIDFIWSGAIFPFDGQPSFREAMARGIPAIGVSFSGRTEYLPYAILVNPLNPDMLAEVLIELQENKGSLILNMKNSAFAYAAKEFDADVLMKRVLDAYKG